MASGLYPSSTCASAWNDHGYGCIASNVCTRIQLTTSSSHNVVVFAIHANAATAAPAAAPPPPHIRRFSHVSNLTYKLRDATADVPSTLEPWLHMLSMEDWNVLIADIGAKNWENAWRAFAVLRERNFAWTSNEKQTLGNGEVGGEGVRQILKIYTTLAKVLAKRGRKEELTLLQAQMKSASIHPDVTFYNAIFHAYANQGFVAEISNGLLQMDAAGVKADHLTYEALISSYLHDENAKLDLPIKVLKNMVEEGLPVGINAFKNLIKAFWSVDDPDGAEEVFELMQTAGQIPDLKVIQKLMQLHARKGNYRRNLELMQLLEKLHIMPNGATYDNLLLAYCKAGLIEEAQKIFQKYESVTRVKPSLVAFNIMIDACGRRGLHELAVQFYADLCDSGLTPNVVSYCSIIGAMVKVKRFTKADQLYKRMLSHNIQPNLHILMLMTHCYTKRKWTKLGHEIYLSLKKSRVQLSDLAYGTFLALYIEGKWYDHAAVLLEEIEREGFNLDVTSNGLLIRLFGRVDDMKLPIALAVQGSNFEVCKLLTLLFLKEAENPKMESNVVDLVVAYLGRWEIVDDTNALTSIYNAFFDCFWERRMIGVVRMLLERARGVYADYTNPQFHSMEWVLNVQGLSVGGAKAAVIDWLLCVEGECNQMLLDDIKMVIITGSGESWSQVAEHKTRETQVGGVKVALLSMLTGCGSPFVESLESSKKLQAAASDVLNWMAKGAWKKALGLATGC